MRGDDPFGLCLCASLVHVIPNSWLLLCWLCSTIRPVMIYSPYSKAGRWKTHHCQCIVTPLPVTAEEIAVLSALKMRCTVNVLAHALVLQQLNAPAGDC